MYERRELSQFPGYAVDNMGTVWSRHRGNGLLDDTWHPLKNYRPPGCWYYRVRVGRFKKETHALVALAFLGPRPEGLQVSHDNGDSTDNRACNLRYVTQTENEAMKRLHGRLPWQRRLASTR